MNEIERLRQKILQVDTKIIELIAKREQIAKKIGKYKKENNLQILDNVRETLLHEFHDTIGEKYNLSSAMVTKIFEILIEESKKIQYDE